MFKSIQTIKNKILTETSRRLLLASGTPPANVVLQKVINLFTKNTPLQSTSSPSSFKSGNVINASEIVNIAKDLQYDLTVLDTWEEQFSIDLNNFKTESKNKIENLFSKLTKDNVTGTTKRIHFNSFDYINTEKTDADINLNSGKYGNGEVVLALNQRESLTLPFKISKSYITQDGRVLSMSNNKYQVFFPGNGQGIFSLIIESNEDYYNTVALSGKGNSIVKLYTITNIDAEQLDKNLIQEGRTTVNSETLLRFKPINNKYLLLEVEADSNTSPSNGEVFEVEIKNLILFKYKSVNTLITKSLSSIPKEKVILNITSSVPKECQLEAAVSYKSAEGPYSNIIKINNLSSQKDLVFWNPDVSIQESIVTSLTPENINFYKMPLNVDKTSDVQIFKGVNQWEIAFRKTDYEFLDNSLVVSSPSEWTGNEVARVFTSRAMYSGDISLSSTYVPLTGLALDTGFIFNNEFGYSTDSFTNHLWLVFKDGVNKRMVPGVEYKLSTYIFVTKSVTVTIGSTVPGADVIGGTLPHALYINNKRIYKLDSDDLLNRSDWVSASSSIHLKNGWNKVELIVSCPNRDKENSNSGVSSLRISFDIQNKIIKDMLNISSVLINPLPFKEIDLFTLNFKNPLQNINVWARKPIGSIDSIVLSNSFGNTPSVFDGKSVGIQTAFLVKEKKYTSFNGVWVKCSLTGDTYHTPEIISMKVTQE